MKRSEVKEQYKWNLADIFPSDEDWERELKETQVSVKRFSAFKGRLGFGGRLLECLQFSDKIEASIEKLYCYARMHRDENGSVDKYMGMTARAQDLIVAFSSASAFLMPALSALPDEYIDACMAKPEFAPYDYMLSEVRRRKQYILPEREEKLLAMAGDALSACEDIFGNIDNVELPLPKVAGDDGKKVQLTHGTYSMLLQSPVAITRKHAFDAYYKTYKGLINTIAATYAGSVKADNFYAAARGYKSAIEKAMHEDHVPSGVYDNLISSVGANLSGVHEYVALRKKALGVERLHMYDMYLPIVENLNLKWEYDNAFDTVVEGLSPLGEEYRELLLRARRERWIDVYETENKRSGAYSWGCYLSHPFVLLNHSGTTHDLFTIAHELGHAMHTYYSNLAQPHAKHSYSIFVAEVASTVNEVLLLKYLISKATDKNLRKYLLSYYLDMFRTTMFRQTMFAEFEKISHDMAAKGVALTPKSLSDKYYKLNKKYYGDAVTHDDLIRYEWARIPHFYSAFYVYKYATGLTAAVNIASAILACGDSAVADYKRFLSSGGSDSPYELLKIAGVDLMQKQPFEVAMAEFRATLDLLQKEFE